MFPCFKPCSYTADPLEEVNPKRKILERLFPDLTTAAGELGTAGMLLLVVVLVEQQHAGTALYFSTACNEYHRPLGYGDLDHSCLFVDCAAVMRPGCARDGRGRVHHGGHLTLATSAVIATAIGNSAAAAARCCCCCRRHSHLQGCALHDQQGTSGINTAQCTRGVMWP